MKVLGVGDKSSRIILLGDGPGKQEEARGVPFVGPAGMELTRYLRFAGLRRDDFYITSLVKWRTDDDNSDPTDEQIAHDEPDLISEFHEIQPRLVVPIGRVAARYVLGQPELILDDVAGYIHRIERHGLEFDVLPVWHPALGLHSPDAQVQIQYGFHQLAAYLKEKLSYIEDAYPEPRYYMLGAADPIPPRLALPHKGPIALDTEGLLEDDSVWGLSFSIEPGVAYVIRRDNESMLQWFAQYVLRSIGPLLLHNAPHDLPILEFLGIHIPRERIVDTMVMAYSLGVEPQGLKALARKHCGMSMRTYLDVLGDADRNLALDYLQRALVIHECDGCGGSGQLAVPTKRGDRLKIVKCDPCGADGTLWPRPDSMAVPDGAGGMRMYTPQPLGKRLRSILADPGDDPRKKWRTIDNSVRLIVERELGPMPTPSLDDADPAESVHYASRDADATLRVYRALKPRIEAMQMAESVKITYGIIPLCTRIMNVGMPINRPYFQELSAELEQSMQTELRAIESIAGRWINPASGPQVADFLFGDLHLKPIKMTKSGNLEATDDKVLETLLLMYPDRPDVQESVGRIQTYREYLKMKGTYADPIPAKAFERPDGWRIGTQYKLTRTATRRLSSSDPNLMNIPGRTKLGLRIKEGFQAAPGRLIGSYDYSQVELVVLAHLSQDANMLRCFREGLDLHELGASKMFGVPYGQVPKDLRSSAKNLNFGIPYGVGPKGLQDQFAQRGVTKSEAECAELITSWFRDFAPGVRIYMDDRHAEARRYGYVRSMFGHVRFLPGIHSIKPGIVSEAERHAGNFPIQCTAQEILQIAMAEVDGAMESIRREGYYAEVIGQIHDELLFEADIEAIPLIDAIVPLIMESVVTLSAPLKAEGVWKSNWRKLKEEECGLHQFEDCPNGTNGCEISTAA